MEAILKVVRKNYIYETLENLMFMMKKLKPTMMQKSILEIIEVKNTLQNNPFKV